jgi:hypothetical protein
MHAFKRAAAAVTAVAALVGGSLALAAPASADNNLTLAGPSSAAAGTMITFTVTGPLAQGTVVLNDANNNQCGATAQIGDGTTVATFQCYAPAAQTVYAAINYGIDGGPAGFSNPLPFTPANGVATATQISAPNTVKIGVATKITVTVAATNAVYQPKGIVVITDQNGNVVNGSLGLGPAGAASSSGYWNWTPQTPGTYVFTAKYQGDGTAQPSTSPQDAINATASGNTISLTAPSTMTVGVPVTLTATLVPASIQGSVGFTLNGAPISGSVPIANGSASFLWTPKQAGNVTLGANYTTNGGQTGSTTDPVTVVAGPTVTDAISLVQPGWGPWNAGGTYTLGNGSNFTFQASTRSGAAVTLKDTGPCQTSGLTITVPTGSGQCVLIASSPGGNGFAAVNQQYTINLIPGNQTANVTAPQSGRLTKGRTYVMENAGQVDTNAGQNITWKVASGKNVCKLGYPADGSVTLKLVKKGSCNVKGTAPGVPGQWNKLVIQRSYRG